MGRAGGGVKCKDASGCKQSARSDYVLRDFLFLAELLQIFSLLPAAAGVFTSKLRR